MRKVATPPLDPTTLPLLPLMDVVVFPKMVLPLFVGREASVKSIELAISERSQIILVTQADTSQHVPSAEHLYSIGVLADIVQLLKLPDGTIKVLVEAKSRFRITDFFMEDGAFWGRGNTTLSIENTSVETAIVHRSVIGGFIDFAHKTDRITKETLDKISIITDTSLLADSVITHLNLSLEDRQKALEMLEVQTRIEYVLSLLEAEIALTTIEGTVRDRVKDQIEKNQRDYYLNEQLKAIQKELGNKETGDEFSELEKQIHDSLMSEEARKKALSELKKLKATNPMAGEAGIIRTYLEWLLALPWNSPKKTKIDLNKASEILDTDHEALDKVKERILEHLAVQARLKSPKGQILCLVGPPGVGKTSLATSIAKASGRDFVRAALGGVRDEAEIRGHRRTYVGALPGRIIQSLKKANSSNPVFLLDEIDKLSSDWKGDPTSALLEVLDPEQNKAFNDHYLEVDFDLSQIMFVATANSLDMPQPLIDRMEVIRLSGYTEQEKLSIATQHLVRKAIESNGLKKKEITIDTSALVDIIRYYTREAGVRNLQREINKLCRKVVRKILEKTYTSVKIDSTNLKDFLGVRKFKYGDIETTDQLGVTTGLAWTEVGGDILQIEALLTMGKGNVKMTGKLGDVMQESVQAAYTYIKSRCSQLGIDPTKFENSDIHIHVPEGATPKDGPSAGVTMCTSITSVMTGIPVHKDVAMTGEITLRGRVLPIGGLKEKLLAALRSGIKTVIIPEDNEKDLEEIPDTIKGGLKIIPVNSVDQVLEIALIKKPKV